MLMKRIMSKLLDNILFGMMVSVVLMVIITVVDGTVQIEAFDQMTVIYDQIVAAGEDTAMIESIVNENAQFLINFANISTIIASIAMILVGFIYFGLLGGSLKGSVGKKLLKLRIVTADGHTPSATTLVIREPLIQIAFISLICTMLSFIVPLFILIPGSLNLVYLILLMLNKDFWNSKLNVRVVSELDLLMENEEIHHEEEQPIFNDVEEIETTDEVASEEIETTNVDKEENEISDVETKEVKDQTQLKYFNENDVELTKEEYDALADEEKVAVLEYSMRKAHS